MKMQALCFATAAALFALPASAQHQQHSTPGAGQSAQGQGVPGSNQNPSAGYAPPAGSQAGGAGGTTAGQSPQMGEGMGHGHGSGGMHGGGMQGMGMSFSQMDTNKDGQISREEWDAMHGGSARSGSGSSR